MTTLGFWLEAALSRYTRGLPPRTVRLRMGKSARMRGTFSTDAAVLVCVIAAATGGAARLGGRLQDLDHDVVTDDPHAIDPHRQHRRQALRLARQEAEGRPVLGTLDGDLIDVDLAFGEVVVLMAADVADGVEMAARVDHRDLLAIDLHAPGRALRDFVLRSHPHQRDHPPLPGSGENPTKTICILQRSPVGAGSGGRLEAGKAFVDGLVDLLPHLFQGDPVDDGLEEAGDEGVLSLLDR